VDLPAPARRSQQSVVSRLSKERASRVRPGYLPAAKTVVASAALGCLTSTPAFGWNAQIAVIAKRCSERVKSTTPKGIGSTNVLVFDEKNALIATLDINVVGTTAREVRTERYDDRLGKGNDLQCSLAWNRRHFGRRSPIPRTTIATR
jgi:hypothetical protein